MSLLKALKILLYIQSDSRRNMHTDRILSFMLYQLKFKITYSEKLALTIKWKPYTVRTGSRSAFKHFIFFVQVS